MAGHALLSASGAKRWLECPPSARAGIGVPNKSSVFAEEGTVAHTLSEIKLSLAVGQIKKDEYDAEFAQIADKVNGEMQGATDFYVELILEKLAEAKAQCGDATLLIEQRLDFSNVVPDGFGTGDAIILCDDYVEVCDLKYGKGVSVSAEDNPQARLYAIGAINLFGPLYQFKEVRSTIIQPRLDSVSSEVLTVEALNDWAENYVKPRAKLAWDGKGEFKTGEHCRFCKIAAKCKARADEALKALEYEFRDPTILADAEIPKILPLLDKLTAWAKDFKEYAYQKALSGKTWDGYKLVEGRSNRTYADEKAVEHRLRAEGLSDEMIYAPKEIRGVTSLEQTLGRKRFQELVGDLVHKPPGKPVLTTQDDKRESLDAASDFNTPMDYEGETKE